MPFKSNTDGEIEYIKDREAICLTEKQANHVYEKVEGGGIVNVNILKKALEQELDSENDNPYKRVVLNKVYREKNETPKVEDCCIFTDQVKYIQHNNRTKHRLDLKTLDY